MSLLSDVKNYLDITWDDPEGDKKLSGIIERGKRYINRISGLPQDYNAEDKPRELLMDYCRYVRDDALDEYMNNYLPEFLSLQLDKSVEWDSDDGGENGGGGDDVSKHCDVYYLLGSFQGGFDPNGATLTFPGGPVRWDCAAGSGEVTVQPGVITFAHGLWFLFDVTQGDGAVVTSGTWPTDKNVFVCGYMHNNGTKKIAEVFGMGTQVWEP